MDRARRDLLRGLGLAGLGLLGGGCGALELLGSLRGRDSRQIGCSLIVSPAWPLLLIEITTDLVVLEKKQLDAREYYVWGLAESPAELADALAAPLRARVSLLLAVGAPAIQAAAAATSSVPIVGVHVGDGPSPAVVEQLVRPGGNLTAVVSAVERQLELFRQTRPDARRVGLLWRPDSSWPADTPNTLSAAASSLSLELQLFELRSASDVDQVIARAGQAGLGGLLLLPEWQTSRLFLRLVEQAASAGLPLISPYSGFAELGALASFGPNLSQLGRAAAQLIGKILDGAAPSSLPLQRVTDVRTAINPIAAGRFGITQSANLKSQITEVVDGEH